MIRIALLLCAPLLAFAHPAIEARVNDLNIAIDKAPHIPELYLLRGQIYANHGDRRRAKQDLESALSIKKNTDVLVALGNLYLSEDDDAVARHYFSEALSMDPGAPEAWLGQAKASAKLGHLELVLTSYQQYFSLAKNAQPGHYAAAIRTIATQDRAEAQRILENGLDRLGPIPTLMELALQLEFDL